jgi:hypothetical protein
MPADTNAESLDLQGLSVFGTVRKSGFPESRTMGVWLSGTGDQKKRA